MTEERKQPLHPLAAAGFVALAGGLLGWLWTGEFRWAITGLVLLLVLTVVSAVWTPGRKR